MKRTFYISISMSCLILFLLIGLTGCGGRTTPTPEIPTVTPTPQVPPTPTPAPDRIVLFDPSAQAGDGVKTILNDFAAANAIGFETWTSMAGDLSGVKIMVLEGTMENLTDVAASAPSTQFLALSQSATPGGNLSTLTTDPLDLTFMAGFLAAMTSQDWRAGALLTDDGSGQTAAAFNNGGTYLCGACTPKYYPMFYYPKEYTVPAGGDEAAWLAQASALWNDTNANSVYIDSAGDFASVLDMFNDEVLYTSNPSSPNLSRYAAVLGADVAAGLQSALPDLLAGSGGKTFKTRVGLLLVNNRDVITTAKLQLFNKVAQDLADGLIVPGSVQ